MFHKKIILEFLLEMFYLNFALEYKLLLNEIK